MTLNPENIDFKWFLVIFCCKRVNCDEMDGDRLRLPANRNCYRLSRVSWALAQISCLWSLQHLLTFQLSWIHCQPNFCFVGECELFSLPTKRFSLLARLDEKHLSSSRILMHLWQSLTTSPDIDSDWKLVFWTVNIVCFIYGSIEINQFLKS